MPPKPLFRAFATLFRAASQEQRDRALRQAISTLVDERGARISTPQPAAIASPASSRWEPLRQRLRALAGTTPGGREAVAGAIGLSPTTFSKFLAPSSAGPGAQVIVRAQRWVDSHLEAAKESPSARRPRPDHPKTTPQARPEANGHDPDRLPVNQLTPQQCDALAMVINLDPRALRRVGVSIELGERATSGGAVPEEIIARLAGLLPG
jgi:hypothetical protein